MLNELLERRYKRYASTQAVIGEKVLPFEEWRNTEEGLTLQNTSVSYTHLRAHETPEHLLLRNLL